MGKLEYFEHFAGVERLVGLRWAGHVNSVRDISRIIELGPSTDSAKRSGTIPPKRFASKPLVSSSKMHMPSSQDRQTLPAYRHLSRCLWQTLLLIAMSFAASVAGIAQSSSPAPSPSPHPPPDRFTSFRRFVEMDAISVATRYRYADNANGAVVANQNQYQIVARGRFKFDKRGRYSIGFGVQTGNNIVAGWDNTGWGTGSPHRDINLRQLYFEAKPVDGLDIQFGGLAFNNGENTEITGYDNDAYLTGERVRITRPKRLYFDEISLTRAFVGDVLQPNVFRRLHRLGEANYYQVLGRKRLNKMVSFSADYTYEAGSDMLRQALKLSIAKFPLLDTVVFENYEQIDPDPRYGFGVYGQKKLNKFLTLGGGFARIDRVMFNADRFPRGNRFYANILVPISREFWFNAVVIHGVGPIAPNIQRTRVDIIFGYNILETLRRFKVQ